MAFANWKKGKKLIDNSATVATHEEKTPLFNPTVASVATVAGIKSEKLDKYAHLITCQQCEHLAVSGYCKVKVGVKPLPDAMHDCQSFDKVQEVRAPIANSPYTQAELEALLSKTEKPLFYHLVECKACDVEAARYCPDGYAIGCAYDALLMAFEDAANKRDALITRMTKARLSGRTVYC